MTSRLVRGFNDSIPMIGMTGFENNGPRVEIFFLILIGEEQDVQP